MSIDKDLPYWLAFWRIPGIGAKHFQLAIQHFSCLAELFEQPETAVRHSNLAPELINALKLPDWQGVEADLLWAQQPNQHILNSAMAAYPPRLKEISNPPPLLFVQGELELLNQPQLAMVGSRHPSVSGLDNAHQFAQAFAKAGLVITSGLALGIDAASHTGALTGGGKTIAVMGTGPDCIYPKSHKGLAKRIIEQGAIVTEFPTGVKPLAANFPRRNRLISGLSLGILVVEAAYGSGSLVTARHAIEQNREVFAIPGSIHNPLARGCHALIKQGAKLVETAQDVLEEFPMGACPASSRGVVPAQDTASSDNPLPQPQAALLQSIGYELTSVDCVIQRSGLTAEEVSSMLLHLELQGYIIAVPGGYTRVK